MKRDLLTWLRLLQAHGEMFWSLAAVFSPQWALDLPEADEQPGVLLNCGAETMLVTLHDNEQSSTSQVLLQQGELLFFNNEHIKFRAMAATLAPDYWGVAFYKSQTRRDV
jgi:hypothetical protein